ncbi:lysophospholipid acyltransferase family protein [Rhodoferax sp.]|jgi:KDO2-lipid IV(A) lauroyltransferase|uniref:lysophospholipid acyltransferase family protein n=1 Tax=Rhodoferax sp. TaxID=50421 RepID=UPI0037839EBE
MTHFSLRLVQWVGRLPLPWVRALGAALGWALYLLIGSRRRVVHTNLRLCFPHWSARQLQRQTRQTFVYFAQAWLDRGWLWYAPPEVTLARLRLVGAVDELDGQAATLIFVPHFVGMDAGWTAMTQQLSRQFTTVYAAQTNRVVDAWILKGRKRFPNGRPFDRREGFKPVLQALRAGEPLCLLPDMNYDPKDSVFVPFYGVSAATIPSLSRVAKMGRAKVIAMISRITPQGYEVEITRRWPNFPSDNWVADTATMNLCLQAYIDRDPAQYYWVHKRFKDRPDGGPSPY